MHDDTVNAFPAPAQLAEALSPHLGAWMQTQRWYGAKSGGAADVRILAVAAVEEQPGHLVLATVVRAVVSGRATDYQVPLVLSRPSTNAEAVLDPAHDAAAEIAVLALPGGPVRVDDATRTDTGRRALLRLVTAGAAARGEGLELQGEPAEGRGQGEVVSTRMLSGEQSNSSMIAELADAAPVIAKLFRVLQEGDNPDVVVQGALDAAGSEQVAPLVGSARISWSDGAGGDAAAHRGHALFVQEFFPGVEDAWRVALRDAVAGTDFTEGARTLGEATARVHRDLADRMDTTPATAAERARMVASMLARLEEAGAEVPAVAERADALVAVLRRSEDVAWPDLQRIHGDYHLGQVLWVPGRGWVLLDFEGEPMRPLAERALPDSSVRDVAGMLRSLDYAAGAVRLEHGSDASAWAADARAAFLAGYADVAGLDADDEAFGVLLAAFEADKAVYEALYEARNRPDWAPIPLAALDRIAG
ncbi:maltokinase N-terminal cap-like domain-containing protein [Brachybacterium huguangmaarense]